MCVRRVGAVGLGGKHPDDSGIPTRSPVGVALSRARPPSALPGRRPRPPHAPTERPPTVSLVYASDRRCTSTFKSQRSQMLPNRILNNEQQHLNRDPATPRKVARTRRRISDRPIRAGHRPARVLPDRPDGGPDQGPRNEKKPWKKRKSLTAGHYSTKDHLRDLPKTELNHKSRLPHGNVLGRGFTVARGAKRCPCSSVVHLR
jgi:hypothetical protein